MNKEIILKKMTLRNFKGVRELNVDFGEKETTISGANATGKTTVFDAFTWCLFGKDSSDRTDSGRGSFTVKTVDPSGNALEKLEHEVEVVMEVNGQEEKLGKILTENWVKPNGQTELVLKGHNTEYLYDGSKIKAGDFQQKVASIVEEQLFKLITNPAYFPSLHWEKQREILLTIAGGVTYEEVAKDRADFLAILSQLGGKDLMEFKQGISYRKKKIKEELDKSPIEINAIDSVTPTAPDYNALESEKEALIAKLEEVEEEVTDVAKTARKHYEKVQEKRSKVNELKSKQQDLLFKAKQNAQKEVFEKNEKRNNAKNELEVRKREAANYNVTSERELSDLRREIESNNKLIESLHKDRSDKVAQWEQRNADEYKTSSEGLICPIYKTLCTDASALQKHSSEKGKAKETFEAAKDSDLAKITAEGVAINDRIEEAEKYALELEAQLKDRIIRIEGVKTGYKRDIAKISAEIEANPEVEVNTNIEPGTLPGWKALDEQIEQIAVTIEEMPEIDTSELTAKKKALTVELDEVKRQLEVKAVIEKNNKRKDEILKREKELAQQMADLEKEEFAIDELNKARIDEVERRVNSKFQNVRFRMFETQINGGETPTCIAQVNGVKYSDLNNAAQINAGLDIVNTLSLFHGVTGPKFIDNAESVNQLFPVAGQLIKLVVTTEKELTVKPF